MLPQSAWICGAIATLAVVAAVAAVLVIAETNTGDAFGTASWFEVAPALVSGVLLAVAAAFGQIATSSAPRSHRRRR